MAEMTTIRKSDRTKPMKRKRVLTEARRKQNRESQKRFRQRKRAKHFSSPFTLSTSLPQETGRHQYEQLEPLEDLFNLDHPGANDVLGIADSSSRQQNSMQTVPASLAASANEEWISSFAQQVQFDLAVPSPYANYLQVQKLNFYAARIQNAIHIGVPAKLAEVEQTLSPWYWDTQFSLLVLNTTPPGSSLDLSRPPTVSNGITFPARFGSFPQPLRPQRCFYLNGRVSPDLAPSQIQREKPHALYIDMIPFPVFRDRIITMLSMDPPAFDEDELRHDMEADGLMVWASGISMGKGVEGMVRDRRNWECARWFFKKWKLLVNGSGLEEQSRWWRSMRGEQDNDDEEIL